MTCCVKGIKIGEGKPKICLPIVGKNDEDIFQQVVSFQDEAYDLVELRIDFYQEINDDKAILNMLKTLRNQLKCPILFTCRTLKEGGEIDIQDDDYLHLLMVAIESGCIDIVDIELEKGNMMLYQLVNYAHTHDVKVLMSHHDFEMTPTILDIQERLEKMEIMGADILKVAYMPHRKKDVVNVLEATMIASEKLKKPIVSMSMGELGKITRLCGELSGSSITFSCATKASAPGQIHVKDMNILLEVIHHD